MKNKLHTMAIILGLLLFPAVAWGEEINVTQVSDFGTLTGSAGNEHYVLTNGNKYTLSKDITLEGRLYVGSGFTVTIDLKGYTLSRNLNEAIPNGYIIYNSGNLTIEDSGTGGKITGGYNSNNGGCLVNEGSGQLIVKGGTITGNHVSSGKKGAGIYSITSGVTISGKISVIGNTSGTSQSNIYLLGENCFTIGAEGLTGSNSSIGITRETKGTFTWGASSADDYLKFVSDNENFVISRVSNTNYNAKICTPWGALQDKLTAGGEVVLDKDYTAVSGDSRLLTTGTVILDLNGHTINRGTIDDASSGYVIENRGSLTIRDSSTGGTGTITGGSGTTLGGIYCSQTSSNLVLEGGTITGNHSSSPTSGAGVFVEKGTISIKGKVSIIGNTSQSSPSNLYVMNGATMIAITGELTSDDASIGISRNVMGVFTSGSSHENNYKKFISDNANYEIAKVSGSDSNAKIQTPWDGLQELLTDGGTVSLEKSYTALSSDAPLTVSGVVILDLKGHTINRGLSSSATANGYVIKVENSGNLTIQDSSTGGTITGGFNSGNGGGIINEGSLTIEGGSITGNKSTGNGAGIYHTGTALTIQGDPSITGNTKSSAANNVYLANEKTIAIGSTLTGAANSIGITMQTRGIFTTGSASAANYQKFSSDDNRLHIINTGDNNAKLQTYWDALQTLLDDGSTVTLTQTYNAIPGLDGPLTINTNVTLDLVTFDIDRNLTSATTNGYVIKVASGKTLTITGTTGSIKGGYNNGNGGGILNEGSLILQGGNITGNKVTQNYNGAGIYNAGTLTMQGAPQVTGNTINGTTANNIYLPSTKLITISNALSSANGTIGVTLQSVKGTFTTGSGTTDNNTKFASDDTRLQVTNDGNNAKLLTEWDVLQNHLDAGDYVLDKTYIAIADIDGPLTITGTKTLTLNGNTIKRNLTSAIDNGYVIKVNSGATLTITGVGTITGGYNTGNGGGIYNAGTLNLQGGTITNNKISDGNGAGIYNEGNLTIGGAVNVTFNAKGNAKNNVYLLHGQKIDITGAISSEIGITHADGHAEFTTNFNNYNTVTYFSADTNGYGIGLNSAGEAIVGSQYDITCVADHQCSITVKSTAVEGELVNVTINPAPNYYACSKIDYQYNNASHLVSYPKETDSFTMPAYSVVVHAACYDGGYCGADDDNEGKNVKWFADNDGLHFIAAEGNHAMKSYAQNAVPWASKTFSAVFFADNITSISPYAFWDKSITSITIPASVATIGEFAFGNCTHLTSITVSGPNAYFSSDEGGVLYNHDKTKLICYPAGKSGTYTLPNSVTAVTEGAFAYCTQLTGISKGGNANFESDEGVLYNSGKTELICYPAGKDDVSLYTIPTSVTTISPYAFFKASHLTKLYAPHTSAPAAGTKMFDDTTFPILVKKNYRNTYKTTWDSYAGRIYEMTLSGAVINLTNNEDAYDYSGSAVQPAVVSVVSGAGDGLTLRPDVDYTVSWSSNESVGTGTVTVTAAGDYSDNGTKTFNITRKVTLNTSGYYLTFYSAENLVKPHDYVKVYTITDVDLANQSISVSTNDIGYIPANRPVLLYEDSYNTNYYHHLNNKTYHLRAYTGSEKDFSDANYKPSSNFLGVTTATALDINDGNLYYILKGDAFYKVTSTDNNLPANRCYLKLGSTAPAAPARLHFSIGNGDDDTTGIEKINSEENMLLFAPDWYTLDGRKLDGMPTKKGLYLNNGRKVIIK